MLTVTTSEYDRKWSQSYDEIRRECDEGLHSFAESDDSDQERWNMPQLQMRGLATVVEEESAEGGGLSSASDDATFEDDGGLLIAREPVVARMQAWAAMAFEGTFDQEAKNYKDANLGKELIVDGLLGSSVGFCAISECVDKITVATRDHLRAASTGHLDSAAGESGWQRRMKEQQERFQRSWDLQRKQHLEQWQNLQTRLQQNEPQIAQTQQQRELSSLTSVSCQFDEVPAVVWPRPSWLATRSSDASKLAIVAFPIKRQIPEASSIIPVLDEIPRVFDDNVTVSVQTRIPDSARSRFEETYEIMEGALGDAAATGMPLACLNRSTATWFVTNVLPSRWLESAAAKDIRARHTGQVAAQDAEELSQLKLLPHPNILTHVGLFEDPQRDGERLAIYRKLEGARPWLQAVTSPPFLSPLGCETTPLLTCHPLTLAAELARQLLCGFSHCHARGFLHGRLGTEVSILALPQQGANKPPTFLVRDLGFSYNAKPVGSSPPSTRSETESYHEHYRFRRGPPLAQHQKDFVQYACDWGGARGPYQTVPHMLALAPEVISASPDKYESSADLWSIGVLVFLTATGRFPFSSHCYWPNASPEEFASSLTLPVCWSAIPREPSMEVSEGASDLAVDFLKQLLCTRPDLRPSSQDAQSHRWLSAHLWSSVVVEATHEEIRRRDLELRHTAYLLDLRRRVLTLSTRQLRAAGNALSQVTALTEALSTASAGARGAEEHDQRYLTREAFESALLGLGIAKSTAACAAEAYSCQPLVEPCQGSAKTPKVAHLEFVREIAAFVKAQNGGSAPVVVIPTANNARA